MKQHSFTHMSLKTTFISEEIKHYKQLNLGRLETFDHFSVIRTQLSRDTLFHLTHLDCPALHPSCCKGEVLDSCPSNCFTGLQNSTLFGSFWDILFYCLYFPNSPPFPTDSLMAFSSSHLSRLKRLPFQTKQSGSDILSLNTCNSILSNHLLPGIFPIL